MNELLKKFDTLIQSGKVGCEYARVFRMLTEGVAFQLPRSSRDAPSKCMIVTFDGDYIATVDTCVVQSVVAYAKRYLQVNVGRLRPTTFNDQPGLSFGWSGMM